MICREFTEFTGMTCFPLDDSGDVAYVASPFFFEDGDPLPIYIKKLSPSHVKFFDDGEIILHFIGRGFRGDKESLSTTFLKNIARTHGLELSEYGVLEGYANKNSAPELFARYVTALLSIVQWEKEYLANDKNALDLIAKVEHALVSWRPGSKVIKNPTFKGISNKDYEFTFSQANEGILVISSSPQSINAATRKLLDVSAVMEATDMKTRVIIDDGQLDAETKEQNHSILSRVSDYVQSFQNLEKIAQARIEEPLTL